MPIISAAWRWFKAALAIVAVIVLIALFAALGVTVWLVAQALLLLLAIVVLASVLMGVAFACLFPDAKPSLGHSLLFVCLTSGSLIACYFTLDALARLIVA